jgi:hypothetical protein
MYSAAFRHKAWFLQEILASIWAIVKPARLI